LNLTPSRWAGRQANLYCSLSQPFGEARFPHIVMRRLFAST